MTHDTPSPLQQIAEHIRDWRPDDLLVDRERRLVRNIALAALESANGYRYSEEALRNAVPLYDGKPVFLDHARNTSRPFERSTRDLVGSVVNPRFENGRLRGDIQTLETEAGRTFVALAESKNPAVGMSQVVLARRNAEGTIVESIEQVVSVDAVAFPATQSTFREQQTGGTTELEAQITAVTSERDSLREQLERHELQRNIADRTQRVEQLLAAAQLPAFAVTKLWKQHLLAAADDETRRSLIAERQTLLQQLRVHAPHSCERVVCESDTVRDEEFVKAVRAKR